MKRLCLLLLPLVLFIAGCADVETQNTPSAPDRPAPGKALAYFYRPARYVGWARGIEISDHDKPVGDLSNGSYFVFQAAPGSHQFMGNGHDEDAAPLTLLAGQTYYFRCTIEMGVWLPHYSVTNVQADQAKYDMTGLKRVQWLGH